MRDWHAYVREQLSSRLAGASCEPRVVRELVCQLTDAFEDAVTRGLGPDEADAFARRQVGEWDAMTRAILQAGQARRPGPVARASDAVLTEASPSRRSRAGRRVGRALIGPCGSFNGLGRRLFRQRWSTAAAVVMLGLGVGSSTAVFSCLYQILYRPTGIHDATSLVQIHQTTPPFEAKMGVIAEDDLPVAALEAQQAGNTALASITLIDTQFPAFRVEGLDARKVRVDFVTADYFRTLGAFPVIGRAFTEEEVKQRQLLAVISDRLWQSAFGRDPQVLERSLIVNGRSCRIIGVAAPAFAGHRLAERTDFWMPWGSETAAGEDAQASGFALARLRPGVSLAQAASVTTEVGRRFRAGLPASELERYGEQRIRSFAMDRQGALDELLPKPWLLLTASMLMLLLACANVANLRLAELEARRVEFASRAALGASPAVLVVQVLAESAVVALAACGVGLLMAFPFMKLLALSPSVHLDEPFLDVTLQPQAVAFAFAASAVSVLVMALLPSIRAARTDLSDVIKGSAGTGRDRALLRDALVALQVALALTLVTGGTFVSRSLDQARREDLGLRPDGVATMRLQFADVSADPALAAAKLRRLREGAERLPGVTAAAVSGGLPLENAALTLVRAGDRGVVPAMMVGAGHFRAVGARLVAGRELTVDDEAAEAKVIVVNEALAKKFWPGQDAIGRKIGSHTVIGVVADHAELSGKSMHDPFAFVRLPPIGAGFPCVMVRTSMRPETLFPAMRQLARTIDPEAPVLRMATLADHLEGRNRLLRIASWLLGLCAIASLALAAMGIQSVLAFRVARGTREIGLRMALGATWQAAGRMVVVRALGSVCVGLGAGVFGAWAMSRAFEGLFVGATALQGGSLAMATFSLLLAAVLAAIGPLWKASSVDPAVALRRE